MKRRKMVVVASLNQPHVINETSLLELSRFGESFDNSLAEGANPLKKSLGGFPYGDKKEYIPNELVT